MFSSRKDAKFRIICGDATFSWKPHEPVKDKGGAATARGRVSQPTRGRPRLPGGSGAENAADQSTPPNPGIAGRRGRAVCTHPLAQNTGRQSDLGQRLKYPSARLAGASTSVGRSKANQPRTASTPDAADSWGRPGLHAKLQPPPSTRHPAHLQSLIVGRPRGLDRPQRFLQVQVEVPDPRAPVDALLDGCLGEGARRNAQPAAASSAQRVRIGRCTRGGRVVHAAPHNRTPTPSPSRGGDVQRSKPSTVRDALALRALMRAGPSPSPAGWTIN